MLNSLSLIKCALAPKRTKKAQCLMSAAGPGSGFILFCICPIAQAQDGACHGTQWLSLRTESPIEPPTGTQHSLKCQATMLRDTPVGVQHFLPLWQEASPPDVPRRSGNHPKAVRAMMNFRNGAAHLSLSFVFEGARTRPYRNFMSFAFVNFWQSLQKQLQLPLCPHEFWGCL